MHVILTSLPNAERHVIQTGHGAHEDAAGRVIVTPDVDRGFVKPNRIQFVIVVVIRLSQKVAVVIVSCGRVGASCRKSSPRMHGHACESDMFARVAVDSKALEFHEVPLLERHEHHSGHSLGEVEAVRSVTHDARDHLVAFVQPEIAVQCVKSGDRAIRNCDT